MWVADPSRSIPMIDDYRGPRVRSRSTLADDGPFAGVRADTGVFAGRRGGRKSGSAGHAGGYGTDDRGQFRGSDSAREELSE